MQGSGMSMSESQQALLIKDTLKRQKPELQVKPPLHMLFIEAPISKYIERCYDSYQGIQSAKQRAQAERKAGVITGSWAQAKWFHSKPFCHRIQRIYTQSLGKGIVPIQKQKVSDMQLTPFPYFHVCHITWSLCPFLQHCSISLFYWNPLPKIKNRRQNNPTHPFY